MHNVDVHPPSRPPVHYAAETIDVTFIACAATGSQWQHFSARHYIYKQRSKGWSNFDVTSRARRWL